MHSESTQNAGQTANVNLKIPFNLPSPAPSPTSNRLEAVFSLLTDETAPDEIREALTDAYESACNRQGLSILTPEVIRVLLPRVFPDLTESASTQPAAPQPDSPTGKGQKLTVKENLSRSGVSVDLGQRLTREEEPSALPDFTLETAEEIIACMTQASSIFWALSKIDWMDVEADRQTVDEIHANIRNIAGAGASITDFAWGRLADELARMASVKKQAQEKERGVQP